MLHPCNRRESFIRAHTKPPQSCEERKSAPPNEVQFNAPTTGSRARHNARLLAVDNLSCYKVVGADYLAFSQFGYIFYVLSMPIESTKELCAYGRFFNGKRS